jgi:ribosomal protein S18 acetylase RimI-like enzyme
MTVREAREKDIHTISRLAQEIWWPTYQDYISKEQISLMLDKMYSEEGLKQQFDSGHQFIILEDNNKEIAFASFSFSQADGASVCKIHKLYILPNYQGMGLGKMLISEISRIASSNGTSILELNVNRNNPALAFYRKYGFTIKEEVDIPYHGFVLNDYIMQKQI